jgi:UDP-N-acetylglucosamine diphosphorylase / glucose-1-phosphate thymidylyltransferase / UDP-N-acetylgalactosamine diphosphorylase / glucosamine-1-phosphate N-acetyltransferase / galactosamine-1-phosphate N-acetyltransferase
MEFLAPDAFFNLESDRHQELFDGCRYVWEVFPKLGQYLKAKLRSNVKDIACFRQPLPRTLVIWKGRVWHEDLEFLGGDVAKGTFTVRVAGEVTTAAVVLYAGSILWDEEIMLGPGTVVEPGALIKGPTLIGARTEVRQGAYIRGRCIVGDGCIVGHTTEMKSSVMLNAAKAGHFAYIGDSILGQESNLGAGTKLANLRIKGDEVKIPVGDGLISTGLRKFGAVVGDRCELGCNVVTNPGTLLGKDCAVFPTISVRPGYYAPETFIRSLN